MSVMDCRIYRGLVRRLQRTVEYNEDLYWVCTGMQSIWWTGTWYVLVYWTVQYMEDWYWFCCGPWIIRRTGTWFVVVCRL